MKKKKSRTRSKSNWLTLLFWAGLGAAIFFVFIEPRIHPTRHEPTRVHVAPPPEAPPSPPPPIVEPPVPNPAAPPEPGPPKGDEKAAPEIVAPPPIAQPRPPVNGHPRIAVILDDVGLDLSGARRATKLPGFITLSFMPYAEHLRDQTDAAKAAGHELMLHMPMEPMGHEDPGPGALFVNLPADEIKKRFDVALASFSGFDGVNNHMGSKFTADRTGMGIVIGELEGKNIFFLDSRTNPKTVAEGIAREHGVPTIARDVFLDDDLSLSAIRLQMQRAETIAQRRGEVVVIGHPHPSTLEALTAWISEAKTRGFVFVPVHDMIR